VPRYKPIDSLPKIGEETSWKKKVKKEKYYKIKIY
jgi:hypothetical protein